MKDLKTLDKTKLAKRVTGFVVGASTTAITHAIIRNNVKDPETRLEQATITTGSTVLGWMVSDKAREFTDAYIDRLVSSAKESKDAVETALKDLNDDTQS